MSTNKKETDNMDRHYLREWREYRGWSQREMAERVGIPKSVISRYETGDRRIHLGMLFRIMAALEIKPGQFFAPPGEPSADAVIANESPEQRRQIVAMLKALVKRD
jgi:transcriptional regulator with XRE-family HTH domain